MKMWITKALGSVYFHVKRFVLTFFFFFFFFFVEKTTDFLMFGRYAKSFPPNLVGLGAGRRGNSVEGIVPFINLINLFIRTKLNNGCFLFIFLSHICTKDLNHCMMLSIEYLLSNSYFYKIDPSILYRCD